MGLFGGLFDLSSESGDLDVDAAFVDVAAEGGEGFAADWFAFFFAQNV